LLGYTISGHLKQQKSISLVFDISVQGQDAAGWLWRLLGFPGAQVPKSSSPTTENGSVKLKGIPQILHITYTTGRGGAVLF